MIIYNQNIIPFKKTEKLKNFFLDKDHKKKQTKKLKTNK